jgi:arylsulfatase A-like enzyme
MTRSLSRLVILFAASVLTAGVSVSDDRPNILLIVADDLGYADLGSYGSDILTPNIDALASQGIRFTHYHTSPYCAPTRAMLLSGNNNHIAGMAKQSATGLVRQHLPGYERHLSDRVAPMPRLLRDAGYHTYSVGKWHLGNSSEHSPRAAGFERSFNLLHGAANHFNSVGFYKGGSLYRSDGQEVEYPKDRYTTELFTDKLISFIESRPYDRPFFAFAAYTSPHWPLQVPEDYLERYRGQYDTGYDALREERFASLKQAGIIPESSKLPPRNTAIEPWDDLDAIEKKRESRKMELYAAMVENLDFHVGRLVAHLESGGLADRTLIVFMSDNGAAGEDFYNSGGWAYVKEHYDNSYENMGQASSWVSYGPQWAEAGSAPFSRYKGYMRQGGVVAPMIIAGNGVKLTGATTGVYATVMDLAPTFIELAGATYPADGSVKPMLGESLVSFLSGSSTSVHADDYTTTLFHAGHASLRQGRWKLTNLDRPFHQSKFELFDLESDPGETRDLSLEHPEKYRKMIKLWRTERKKMGIILPGDL